MQNTGRGSTLTTKAQSNRGQRRKGHKRATWCPHPPPPLETEGFVLNEWRDRLQNLLGRSECPCPSRLESSAARYSVICHGFLSCHPRVCLSVATLQMAFPNSILHLEGTCSHPVPGQHKRTEGLVAWAVTISRPLQQRL